MLSIIRYHSYFITEYMLNLDLLTKKLAINLVHANFFVNFAVS